MTRSNSQLEETEGQNKDDDNILPEVRAQTEETTSAYFQFNDATEYNGMPINVQFGVRWEQTDVVALNPPPATPLRG